MSAGLGSKTSGYSVMHFCHRHLLVPLIRNIGAGQPHTAEIPVCPQAALAPGHQLFRQGGIPDITKLPLLEYLS